MIQAPYHVEGFFSGDEIKWGWIWQDQASGFDAQLEISKGKFLNCGSHNTALAALRAIKSKANELVSKDPLVSWRQQDISFYVGKLSAKGKWAIAAVNTKTGRSEITGVEFDSLEEAKRVAGGNQFADE
jgi:hypothetical protein